jgi:hypothetical protein
MLTDTLPIMHRDTIHSELVSELGNRAQNFSVLISAGSEKGECSKMNMAT